MITAEAITTIQTRQNSINHRVLHSLLIVIVELELFFSDCQAHRCLIMLYAIRHFTRITLFVETTPHPGSSTEHVFRAYQVVSFWFPDFRARRDYLPRKMNLGWQHSQSQVYSMTRKHRKEMGMFPEEVL